MNNEPEKITVKKDLVQKRKAVSLIWNCFSYKKDDIKTHVLCQQCLAPTATTRGSTTNLFDQLCQHHTAIIYSSIYRHIMSAPK